MAERECPLCSTPITEKDRELCQECHAMEQRLNFLIENDRKAAAEFIAIKFNEASDPRLQQYDRRKTSYKPPPGTHTPDRRRKIRRVAFDSSDAALKRRQSDQ